MNNEPVAWMVNGKAYEDIYEAEHYSKFTNTPMLTLYTHPADLTDEEIIGAIARGWCSEKNSSKTMDSDLAMAIADEIKAILRKAQEK